MTEFKRMVSQIRERVRNMDLGYFSTTGWCASSWYDDDLNLHVKLTIEPYGVQKYLELLK